MTRFAVVDGTGAVVAGPTSRIGACRKIAAASDEPMTWRDVASRLEEADTIELVVVGGLETYAIVPWTTIHTV